MAQQSKPLMLLSTILTGVLIAANLFVANLWLKKLDLRYDLTADKRFEIGQGTETILGRLEDTVSIKCYFSSNVPKRYRHNERIVAEKLREYEARAGAGKIVYEFVDPGPETNPEAEQECKDLGILPAQVEEFEDVTTPRVVICYMSMVFRYGDRKQVVDLFRSMLPSLEDPARFSTDLEYYLTNSIQKVSVDPKTVGFLADIQMVPTSQMPGAEKRKYQGADYLKGILEGSYDVIMLDPKEVSRGTIIPAEIDTIVVYEPRDYSEAGCYVLDQFVMRGGNALFLVDAGTVEYDARPKQTQLGGRAVQDFDNPTYAGQLIDHKIGGLLEHYGVRVESAFIEDPSAYEREYIRDKEFAQNILGQVFVKPTPGFADYRSWVVVPARDEDGTALDPDQIPRSQSVVPRDDTFVFTWAAPLTVIEDNVKSYGGAVTPLVKSGPESSIRPIKDGVFSPESPPDPAADKRQSIIGVLLSGEFRSYFKGREIPAVLGANGDPLPVKDELVNSRLDQRRSSGEIIVFGDADFLGDKNLAHIARLEQRKARSRELAGRKAQAVLTMASNAVDMLTYGGDASALFDIKGRVVKSRQIKKVPNPFADTKFIFTLMMIGAVILFGFVRWGVRKLSTTPTRYRDSVTVG